MNVFCMLGKWRVKDRLLWQLSHQCLEHTAPRFADFIGNVPHLPDGTKWREQHCDCVSDLVLYFHRNCSLSRHAIQMMLGKWALLSIWCNLHSVQPLMKLLGVKSCAGISLSSSSSLWSKM